MTKRIKIIYSIAYFILLGYAVFFSPRRRDREYYHEINLVPVKYSLHYYKSLSSYNKTEVFNFYLNLFGNVLLFVPFAFIAISLFKRNRLITVVLFALCLSIFIETVQYIFGIGFADIDDLILNTLGSIVGFYLYKIFSFQRFSSPIKGK